jgi:hypothetical protein
MCESQCGKISNMKKKSNMSLLEVDETSNNELKRMIRRMINET